MASSTEISRSQVRQFSVFLQNRVGAFLSLVRLMNDAHVLVLGHSVQDHADVTLVRMVVTDPETLETLFIERGIPHAVREMVVVELKEAPADFGRCLAALLAAEVNIQFCYPLMSRPNGHPVLALAVEETDFTVGVLRDAGFKTLSQDELSR